MCRISNYLSNNFRLELSCVVEYLRLPLVLTITFVLICFIAIGCYSLFLKKLSKKKKCEMTERQTLLPIFEDQEM